MKHLLLALTITTLNVACVSQGAAFRPGVAQRLSVKTLQDGTKFSVLDEGPDSGGSACN